MRFLSRRAVALAGLGGASAALSGCAALRDMPVFGTLIGDDWPRETRGAVVTPDYGKVYARVRGERHPIPAVDYTMLDPTFLRADVAYGGMEPPGTVVVDPRKHLLFLVEPNGRALRYGIAVGRESRGFFGPATVAETRRWPDWNPTPVIAARMSGGTWAQLEQRPTPAPAPPKTVPGGPRSPRGARALYLTAEGRDAGYVIHGTPRPDSVGTDVVDGCIGLINQDAIHLADRVGAGARVVVLG